jgi:HPt (histidine-containing phosphotransfer) domain-containing protein
MDWVIRQWVRDKTLEQEMESAEALPVDSSPPIRKTRRHIEGLDWKKGISRFGDNEDIYQNVLRSYLTNTTRLLEQMRDLREGSLSNYVIVVHGIKGSSYGIEAGAIGRKAEELENAARAGDFEFVRTHNPVFIRFAEEFLEDLSSALVSDAVPASGAEGDDRESRIAPDEALLARMLEAAGNFKIDLMEEIMDELERFRYENESELVSWLREQVGLMEFAKIRDRLSQRKSVSP